MPAAFVQSISNKRMTEAAAAAEEVREEDLEWKAYTVDDLDLVTSLIDNELSEPYSIFTYRYFLNQWPQLCILVLHKGTCVGTVVCKMDRHRGQQFRGYIAMLVVDKPYRKLRLGSKLVCAAFKVMIAEGVEEVMLEAETNNYAALKLYENLGFIRDKRLHKYYLSGQDAFRLKMLLPAPTHLTYDFIDDAQATHPLAEAVVPPEVDAVRTHTAV